MTRSTKQVRELAERLRDEVGKSSLHIQYKDDAGKETSRVISPLFVLRCKRQLSVKAHCSLRNQLRLFRLDRIGSVDPVPLAKAWTTAELVWLMSGLEPWELRAIRAAQEFLAMTPKTEDDLLPPTVVTAHRVSLQFGPTPAVLRARAEGIERFAAGRGVHALVCVTDHGEYHMRLELTQYVGIPYAPRSVVRLGGKLDDHTVVEAERAAMAFLEAYLSKPSIDMPNMSHGPIQGAIA